MTAAEVVIAATLRQHDWDDYVDDLPDGDIEIGILCPCGWKSATGGLEDHLALVVAEALEASKTITTQRELDAMPFLTVIREVFRDSPSGLNYGGIYERRTSGWECLAGVYKDGVDNGAPKLPCHILYGPSVRVEHP